MLHVLLVQPTQLNTAEKLILEISC